MLYHHALIEKTTILGVSYLTDKPLPVTGHEAHGLSPGFNQLCKFLVSFPRSTELLPKCSAGRIKNYWTPKFIPFWLVGSNIFVFHNIWDNPSHWLTHIFEDGYCTTNQHWSSIWKSWPLSQNQVAPWLGAAEDLPWEGARFGHHGIRRGRMVSEGYTLW